MSARRDGSSMPDSVASSSGGSLRLSLTNCSNSVDQRARRSTSTSRSLARVDRLEHADLRDHRMPSRSPNRQRSRRALVPSTSTLIVPSGSFSSCSTLATVPIEYRSPAPRIVDIRTALRDEQDLLVAFHRDVERAHGFLAADEQRDDHVRKHDDVAQRQDRQLVEAGFGGSGFWQFFQSFGSSVSRLRIGSVGDCMARACTRGPSIASSKRIVRRECKQQYATRVARRTSIARIDGSLRRGSPAAGGRYGAVHATTPAHDVGRARRIIRTPARVCMLPR